MSVRHKGTPGYSFFLADKNCRKGFAGSVFNFVFLLSFSHSSWLAMSLSCLSPDLVQLGMLLQQSEKKSEIITPT